MLIDSPTRRFARPSPRALWLVATVASLSCQGHDTAPKGQGPLAAITLTTTAVIVAPGETLAVTATPRDSAGTALSGLLVNWTSSAPSIATIDASGVVTAVAGGMATLTASIGGKSASVTITVRSPAPPPPADTVDKLGSWTLVLDRPLSSKYEGMAFPDSLHGWVVSDRGDIVATADGGATWTQQATGLGLLRSLDFLDSTHGFAGTLQGQLYRTNDAGATWTNIAASLPIAPIGFCGVTHVGNHVHVVGRYVGATSYYRSLDGGDTWQYRSLATLMSGLVDVSFIDSLTGFIGGTGISTGGGQGPATLLKTTDGGDSWRIVFTNDGGPGWAWKIFPVSASVIYVSLESLDGVYRVIKSTDGGESWDMLIVATGQPLGGAGGLQGIGFLDANVGWVGGFFTGMYATTNGGLSWTPIPVTSANINRYRRAGNTLFTAGTKGVLRYVPKP
jgi:photosystem II stability/assembly factor-like uncharacterized protein